MSKRKAQKKERLVFEPATEKQICYLLTLVEENGLSPDKWEGMLRGVSGLPFIDFLSNPDAHFLIGRLSNKRVQSMKPIPGKSESRINGGESLPSMRIVKAIRDMFSELGWNREKINQFLDTKGIDFRSMDRNQANQINKCLRSILVKPYSDYQSKAHMRAIRREAI